MARNLWYELDLRTPNAFGYPAENELCALYITWWIGRATGTSTKSDIFSGKGKSCGGRTARAA